MGVDTSPAPDDAIAERAVEWAHEAGLTADPAAVLAALERREVVVEVVFSRLLETLGILASSGAGAGDAT